MAHTETDRILSRFIVQFGKQEVYQRATMNQQINDIRILVDKMGSECPIKGMRVSITGRLGSRKNAMAALLACKRLDQKLTSKKRLDLPLPNLRIAEYTCRLLLKLT